MRLFGLPVGQLASDHIDLLSATGAGESRTLEFKSKLPGASPEEKKEFLADVTALANTVGGVIIYGIETERDATGNDTGVAKTAVGLGEANADKEKQRLLSMLHDGIRPSLAAHTTIQDIKVPGANGPVIALGVGQSLARPHMVTFSHTNKFWRRSDAGKYQPDIIELRSMFLEAHSWLAEAERFRLSRIERVLRNGAIPRLQTESGVFIHVLPLGRQDVLLDLSSRAQDLGKALPPPVWPAGYGGRYNADGCICITETHDHRISGYTQWFRFGGVEGYESGIVGDSDAGREARPRPFWAAHTCKVVSDYLAKAIPAIGEMLQVDPPFAVFISLFGLRGAVITTDDFRSPGTPFVEESVLLPALVVEAVDADLNARLKPLLDVVWQAGGLPGMPNK